MNKAMQLVKKTIIKTANLAVDTTLGVAGFTIGAIIGEIIRNL